MNLLPIDISSLPVLETAVGLFGSVTGGTQPLGPSLFEVILTLVLIIYD